MSSISQKLSVQEKIGYSLGDLSANLVFQTLIFFLLNFYTDVYGLSPAKAGSIMFVVGLIGAAFNPIVGAMADRTDTKWGKFRPWVLWTAIPFGIAIWLVFSTPNFGETGKVVYAFVTYLFLLFVYAANNLPYSALSGVMTGDMIERTSLSSYRFIAVMVAMFLTQVMLLPMVDYLGQGDRTAGFQYTIGIFAVIAVVGLLITFFASKERIKPIVQEKTPLKQDLDDLTKNKPWIIIFIVTTAIFISLAMRGGMLVYYFNEYLNESHLASFLASIGMDNLSWVEDTRTGAFSVFNGLGIIASIIGIFFSKPLAAKYGKRDVFGIFLLLATIFIALFGLLSPEAITLVFVFQFLQGFFYGVTIPLLWAMIADVADFSEWKNNRRATAIIFSAMIVGLKIGLTLGGSLSGYILAYYGYDANLEVQNENTIGGIKMLISIYPAITFIISCILLFFYEINKKMEFQIEKDLKNRRIEAARANS